VIHGSDLYFGGEIGIGSSLFILESRSLELAAKLAFSLPAGGIVEGPQRESLSEISEALPR
jgi:hypothetical protein